MRTFIRRTKSTVRLKSGINCDLRIVPEESFGAALQYFTGSKQHNVLLRTVALHKGYKLNEYGLYDKRNRQIGGKTEESIYSKLGLPFITPELREDKGEIDGNYTIIEMAEAASKAGLEYIAITDHSQTLEIAHGLNERKLKQQEKEIKRVNNTTKQNGRITILTGVEVNILKDGSLDLENNILMEFDIVGAAVHSHFSLSKEEQTKRVVSAMYNRNVDILFHPTCRVIQKRHPLDIDFDKILDVSKETNTILEVDSSPDRLDLQDEYIQRAIENKCKIVIDSDAHDKSHFHFLKFGISQARRGWAEKKDVVNTLPLEKFLKSLK